MEVEVDEEVEEVEVEDWDGSIRSESNLQVDIRYSPDSTIYGRIQELERERRLRRVVHIICTIYKHTQ